MNYWYDKEFKGIICEPSCADEWLELIWDISIGYDGCYTVESLQGLVDELREMSTKARECLYDGKIFKNVEEDVKSREAAHEERKRCEDGEAICGE